MNREELIEHWAAGIIPAVFKAEDNIRPKLQQILDEHKEDKEKGAYLYCRAIAEEIVSKITNKQIEES